jgi:hypothetical protein
MALQGTLDTFELPDVLRLLSSTKKTGRLRLQTDRGDGNVWVDEGLVVGVASPSSSDGEMSEALFDLLRSREGSFVFQAGELAPAPGLPTDVEPLLVAAEERLTEWREIEKVVPSMYAHVRLAEELPAPQVTIDADAWRTVTAIGSGVSVAELGRTLDLSEVGVCRLVRDLVELGLGTVTDDAPAVTTPAASSWDSVAADRFKPIEFDDPVPATAAPAFEPELPARDRTGALSFDPSDLLGDADDAADDAGEAVDDDLAPVTPLRSRSDDLSFDDDLGGGSESADEMDDEEADEVARQLAKLSPRAAQAVAAAAAAETEDERNAALEALDDETDETVNRSLLLKFLGSPRG